MKREAECASTIKCEICRERFDEQDSCAADSIDPCCADCWHDYQDRPQRLVRELIRNGVEDAARLDKLEAFRKEIADIDLSAGPALPFSLLNRIHAKAQELTR